MDSYPMVFSGCLLLSVGLIVLVLTTYGCLFFSISLITEVIAAILVTVLGICLLKKGLKNKEDSVAETEETEQSGRMSPYYYELEPTLQKRDLPPIPRDIGREYDPVITDKVWYFVPELSNGIYFIGTAMFKYSCT